MKKLLIFIFFINSVYAQKSIDNTREKVLSYKEKITSARSYKVPVARIIINHNEKIGDDYLLVNLRYFLDGEELIIDYKEKDFIVYDSYLVPSVHELKVQAVYAGNRTGIFNYLNDYRIRVEEIYSFESKAGDLIDITTQTYKKGSFLTSFKNRPSIRFYKKIEKI